MHDAIPRLRMLWIYAPMESGMSHEPARNLIWKHIRAIETCMLVTHFGDQMRARPMRGIARPEQNAIWFFSDSESHTDEQLRANPDVCLSYADIKSNVYVSVSGQIARVTEKTTINDLWDDDASGYFPKGPSDPRVVLLRFEPETGEYWRAPSSPIILAIKFLEAKVTGERPAMGESGSARLGPGPVEPIIAPNV
jgi:general stress protein 26